MKIVFLIILIIFFHFLIFFTYIIIIFYKNKLKYLLIYKKIKNKQCGDNIKGVFGTWE